MTKAEQKTFVRDLSKSVAKSICQQIADGKVPSNWDGHELRALLAYRHGLSASTGQLADKKSKRYRDFKNTVLVSNL